MSPTTPCPVLGGSPRAASRVCYLKREKAESTFVVFFSVQTRRKKLTPPTRRSFLSCRYIGRMCSSGNIRAVPPPLPPLLPYPSPPSMLFLPPHPIFCPPSLPLVSPYQPGVLHATISSRLGRLIYREEHAPSFSFAASALLFGRQLA